jgi:hypothetical protein
MSVSVCFLHPPSRWNIYDKTCSSFVFLYYRQSRAGCKHPSTLPISSLSPGKVLMKISESILSSYDEVLFLAYDSKVCTVFPRADCGLHILEVHLYYMPIYLVMSTYIETNLFISHDNIFGEFTGTGPTKKANNLWIWFSLYRLPASLEVKIQKAGEKSPVG